MGNTDIGIVPRLTAYAVLGGCFRAPAFFWMAALYKDTLPMVFQANGSAKNRRLGLFAPDRACVTE